MYREPNQISNEDIYDLLMKMDQRFTSLEQRVAIIEGREQLDVQDRKRSFSGGSKNKLNYEQDIAGEFLKSKDTDSSSGGSSDESNPKSNSNSTPVKKNKEKGRRKSQFIRSIEENTKLAKTVVRVNRDLPSHSHIYLKSLELTDYVQFVQNWFRYQAKHNISLEVNQVVHENVKQVLMVNNDLSETEFKNLSPSEFCQLMAKETKIVSVAHFYDTLSKALSKTKPMSWKTFVPANHEHFYQGILTRQKLFSDLFYILMDNNRKYCPAIGGKSTGLAHLYLTMYDKDYANAVLKEMKQPINETNYPKIDVFLKGFAEVSKRYYEASRAMNLIPYSHSFFSDQSDAAKERNGILFS